MKHGSLFSGIGGFDLASQWMGWENVFHCEWNPFCQKVLKYYWPKAISYEDITKTDFTIHRGTIDVLTGGFPCQPYSVAGKRLGKEDERHLWPEMLRCIREVQPTWVVGENVFGLVSWNGGMVFEEVQADLEDEGYEVQAYVLPACAVNAPHRRDRVWIVAHRNDRNREEIGLQAGREVNVDGAEREGPTPNGSNTGIEGLRPRGKNSIHGFEPIANTTSQGRKERKQDSGCQDETENRTGVVNELERFGSQSDVANTEMFRRDDWEIKEWCSESPRKIGRCDSDVPNWDKFPVSQPAIRRRNDGLPCGLVGITISKHRTESIKGYGNAVVPQVPYQIFKAIEAYEN